MVGARYNMGLAAGSLAQAMGWQFVPVRSDIEVTADGRLFPVARERDGSRFARISRRVFSETEAAAEAGHTLADERQWIEENGPWSPALRP